MSDPFFSQTECDRCPNPLTVRTMSWFNEDTICTICIDEEKKLKQALQEYGVNVQALEGCGYIPEIPA